MALQHPHGYKVAVKEARCHFYDNFTVTSVFNNGHCTIKTKTALKDYNQMYEDQVQ